MADSNAGPNVLALSTALATALSPILHPIQQQSSTDGASSSTPSTSAGARMNRPNQILPSFLKRKARGDSGGKSKKPRALTTWDRDIVCLPNECKKAESAVPYPRGNFRARLCEEGLVGKVRLTSHMSVEEVEDEIRSVFNVAMQGDPSFPFKYLQATGGGNRSLSVPSVSASFQWTAQQVAKLGNQRNVIYILAEKDLVLRGDVKGSDEEESLDEKGEERVPVQGNSGSSQNVTSVMQNQDTYSTYVNLIDLTGCEDVASDTEDLPPAVVSLPTCPLLASSGQPGAVDTIKIKHIMQQHRDVVITSVDDEDVQRIHVRRSHMFADSCRQFSKDTFNVSKMLKVTFIGESAVDDGGPRREYFQHIQRDIAVNSGLFTGWPEHVLPLHNVDALMQNKFYVVGKIMATVLVQGGQPPVCFSSPVADFLVFERVRSEVCLADIPDIEVRQCLQKVTDTTTTDQLRSLFSESVLDFRFQSGYTKPAHNIELKDKDNFVRSIWLHHVLFQPYAELDQLRKGFQETLQLHLLACIHSEELRALLAYSTMFNVSVEYLQDMFVIQYSDNGSNNRTKEEAVVLFWFEYITNCKEGRCVALEDILQFISGATKLPATGFDETPKISFMSQDRLPVISTCALLITFPRSYGLLLYEDFENKMDFCIKGSFGFGSV